MTNSGASPGDRAPTPGQIITYVDDESSSPYGRAVSTGDVIIDPGTQRHWFPVIRPDLGMMLLDADKVVHGSGPATGR